jgi:chromosome segregation ATPase
MRPASAVLLACVAVAVLHPCSALADAATETRLREALRSATSQLRTLEDERGKRQSKEAEQQKELESLRGQLAKPKQAPGRGGGRRVAELEQRVAELSDANAALREANGKLNASVAQSEKATQEASEAARSKEDERARLAAQVSSLHSQLSASEARNGRLYKVGKDIIDWLSKVGVGTALAAREPFLGVKRVELENVAQGYEDKLLEQKAKPQP